MLHVALIGLGGVTRSHIEAWMKCDEARVIGVADLVPERAEAAARRLDADRWTTDYTELLERETVEAVDVCTTEATHG